MEPLHQINFAMKIAIVHLIFSTALVRLESQTRTSFFFTITSGQNSTGHRHVKAVCNIPVPTARIKPNTVDDIRLDVQQLTHFVENIKYLQLTTIFNVPAQEREPPPGYELVPGLGWYRLHLAPLTWEEARLACEAEGAHLAVLNSQEEADALKGIFARAPDKIPGATYHHVAIIGFKDLVEGKYYTIFGETLEQAGYAVWGSGQPNNANGPIDSDSDCGGIERTGKLNDLPCRSLNAYFCEFPL